MLPQDDRAVSRISRAYPDRVEVRGRDLTGELMGRVTFTEYFHLLLTGREATDDQRFFLDLLLVSIAEHGMMPSNVAARMTLAADPERCKAQSRRGSWVPAPSSSGRPASAHGCSRTRSGGLPRATSPQPSRGSSCARSGMRAARFPASVIRCTGRRTRGQSESSSSPTSAV